jgi:hypothetical protein
MVVVEDGTGNAAEDQNAAENEQQWERRAPPIRGRGNITMAEIE